MGSATGAGLAVGVASWVGVIGLAGLASIAACSGSSAGHAPDADAAIADSAASPQDGTTAPHDAGAVDAPAESSRKGHCGPIEGGCDLVLQTCAAGTQCVAQPGDAGTVTACGPTYPVQHIAPGYACCPPSTPAGDSCLPGSACVGEPCIGDAGGGRCSPYCCAGDDTPCGLSPEGFTGHCDIGVVGEAGATLYDVCDYAPPCAPLGVLACPSGYTCLVEGTTGGARCSPIFNGGAAAAGEGDFCAHDNSCQSGLMCLTTSAPDGGPSAACFLLCYTGQGTPPFDAGALGMTPGTGACNPGEQCATATQIFPAWLGVCVP